jgi:predicted  nucleic acid-binding Zn-ribbon protein
MSKKKQIKELKFYCSTLETEYRQLEERTHDTNMRLTKLRSDFTKLTEAHNNSLIEINNRLKTLEQNHEILSVGCHQAINDLSIGVRKLEKECLKKNPEINELSTRLISK